MKISDLFDVSFGSKLDLVNLVQVEQGGVNFVSRGQKNNGVSARVATLDHVSPFPAGCLTVALGGSIFETFLQPEPFYTSQNVAVLTPREPMPEQVLLFYCAAIAKNKYRFTYGRHANRTVKDIQIPAPYEVPAWAQASVAFDTATISASADASISGMLPFGTTTDLFKVGDLFDVFLGEGFAVVEATDEGETLVVSSTAKNNGVAGYTNKPANHLPGTLTVSRNGSVGEAFFHSFAFCATEDVNVLNAKKWKITPEVGLFLATVLRQERYRFHYGRKLQPPKLAQLTIRLPAISRDGESVPDFSYMERFIRSLPFSSQV